MKILYISTLSNTINAFLIPHIKMLIKNGATVDVAANIVNPFNRELDEIGCKMYDLPFHRNPLKNKYIYLLDEVRKIVLEGNYNIIHTHTPIASAIVRLACKNLENTRVIYTAHGFHFYDGAPLKNWLLFYPVEKLLSHWTDTIITINEEDYERAKSFNAKEVKLVNGVGIDLNKFNQKTESYFLRKELNLSSEDIILLSVGELNDNKNHQIIIKALAKLNNRKIHYVIAGEGDNKTHLVNLAKELGIPYQLHLLGFRDDISQIYPQVDMFIFPSQREGLSASLMEAMASGLPIICSNIRGNTDLIDHNEGGYLINQKNTDEYSKRINELYQEKSLRDSFGKYNQEKIKDYSIENVLESMCNIYSDY